MNETSYRFDYSYTYSCWRIDLLPYWNTVMFPPNLTRLLERGEREAGLA